MSKRPSGPPPGSDGLSDEEGGIALEFALLAPALLFLLIGIAAVALYFAIYVGLVHATTEGARASVGGLGPADRNAAAVARVQDIFSGYGPLLSWENTQVTTGVGPSTGTYAVTVSYAPGDLGLSGFFNLWSALAGTSRSGPATISYTVTVANGGYS